MTTTPPSTAALYRAYGPLLYARCRRALQDEAQAEAATQALFLRLLPRLESATPAEAVKAIAQACAQLVEEQV